MSEGKIKTGFLFIVYHFHVNKIMFKSCMFVSMKDRDGHNKKMSTLGKVVSLDWNLVRERKRQKTEF